MNVLVTGAASGLGEALARRAQARSRHVIGLDRAWPEGDRPDDKIIRLTRDLADLKPEDPITDILEHAPYVTVILNAAISATGPFETIPEEVHRRVTDVNLTAPVLIIKRLLEANALPPGASIVLVSSLSVRTGYPGAASYAASKAALASLGTSMRRLLKWEGIHVMTVFPGPMRTAQAERHAPPDAKAESRMDPDAVARNLYFQLDRRFAEFVPGTQNQLVSASAKLAPGLFDRIMRKIIYDKLDRSVY